MQVLTHNLTAIRSLVFCTVVFFFRLKGFVFQTKHGGGHFEPVAKFYGLFTDPPDNFVFKLTAEVAAEEFVLVALLYDMDHDAVYFFVRGETVRVP